MTVTAARDAKASVPDSDTGAATGRTGPHPIMAVPALAFFGAFALVPLVGVVVLSFVHWDGISAMTWAGFDNWGEVLTAPTTLRAVWLSVQVMVFSWLVQTPISLLLGVLIAGRGRYRAVLGVLYFLPMLLSSAAIAISFKALLDPNFGMSLAFNAQVLAQDWLGDPSLALYVVVFVIAWQFVPFHTLLYQAAVRQIPHSLYEAATLDGAGTVKQFWYITLPQLRNTVITSSTLMVTGSLTYFDVVFVLTGGGPGNATKLLPVDMYLTGFQANEMGEASVLAVILVVIGLGLAFVMTRVSGFSRMSSDREGL
jgi:raffinose/stachyose/melibiose transport system permease protein